MEIKFNYGAMADSLEEQAKKQGYTFGENADKFEKIRFSINMCKFHVATDSQVASMFNKLHKLIEKSIYLINC